MRFEFFRHSFSWRRLRVVLIAAAMLGALLSLVWVGSVAVLFLRLLLVGLILLTVFALAGRWPVRLPPWAARWTLQIVAVALAVPVSTALVYWLTTLGDPVIWYRDQTRMSGYSLITGFSILVSPWVAMVAVYRDISGRAHRQALEFELERRRFAEQALQARMNQLQAQVEPHFLFNTLANIRELVEQGSPHAPRMLESLIGYLRAAVPRLHESTSTIGHELDLVRSYLSVMKMRMPDRLTSTVRCAREALDVPCPPGAILVLVENSVRHGIDPSEIGGSIDVEVRLENDQCVVDVQDNGTGLGGPTAGLGTGLANLRERLRLGHGPCASVELENAVPHGTRAQLRLPRGGTDES